MALQTVKFMGIGEEEVELMAFNDFVMAFSAYIEHDEIKTLDIEELKTEFMSYDKVKPDLVPNWL